MTPAQLTARIAAARERLARPWEPDTGLPAAIDAARDRLGLEPRYLDLDALEEQAAREFVRAVDREIRESRRGLTWEHRHACPDCPCFRTPGSTSCNACGSTSRAIPAHERAGGTTNAGVRANAARRRYEKRRRVQRGY